MTNPSKLSKYHFIIPKVIKLYNRYPRLTYEQIAEELGITVSVLAAILSRLVERGEIDQRRGSGLYELSDAQIARLKTIIAMRVDEKMSWKKIGEKFGMSRQAVNQYVAYHLPELKQQLVRPETAEKVKKIHGMRQQRKSWKDIAIALKVDPASVASLQELYYRNRSIISD